MLSTVPGTEDTVMSRTEGAHSHRDCTLLGETNNKCVNRFPKFTINNSSVRKDRTMLCDRVGDWEGGRGGGAGRPPARTGTRHRSWPTAQGRSVPGRRKTKGRESAAQAGCAGGPERAWVSLGRMCKRVCRGRMVQAREGTGDPRYNTEPWKLPEG